MKGECSAANDQEFTYSDARIVCQTLCALSCAGNACGKGGANFSVLGIYRPSCCEARLPLPLCGTMGKCGKNESQSPHRLWKRGPRLWLMGAVLYPLWYLFGCQISWLVPPGPGGGVRSATSAPTTGGGETCATRTRFS